MWMYSKWSLEVWVYLIFAVKLSFQKFFGIFFWDRDSAVKRKTRIWFFIYFFLCYSALKYFLLYASRGIWGKHLWVGAWISFVYSPWNPIRMSKGRRELWQAPRTRRREAYHCRDWLELEWAHLWYRPASLHNHKWSMKLHHWVMECNDLHCMWHLSLVLIAWFFLGICSWQ